MHLLAGVVYRVWTIDGLLAAREKGAQTALEGGWDPDLVSGELVKTLNFVG